MHLGICDSVLHFRCVESETVLIKEESSELSTRYEDKLTESTEVEIDNWDKQKNIWFNIWYGGYSLFYT